MDKNGVWRFPEGSGRQGRVERYCCKVICGAPTTSEVKGLRWDEQEYVLIYRVIPWNLIIIQWWRTHNGWITVLFYVYKHWMNLRHLNTRVNDSLLQWYIYKWFKPENNYTMQNIFSNFLCFAIIFITEVWLWANLSCKEKKYFRH